MTHAKEKINKIDDALTEATRFMKRAKEWKAILKEDPYHLYGSKEGGAAKRASLDLTRSLAELRK